MGNGLPWNGYRRSGGVGSVVRAGVEGALVCANERCLAGGGCSCTRELAGGHSARGERATCLGHRSRSARCCGAWSTCSWSLSAYSVDVDATCLGLLDRWRKGLLAAICVWLGGGWDSAVPCMAAVVGHAALSASLDVSLSGRKLGGVLPGRDHWYSTESRRRHHHVRCGPAVEWVARNPASANCGLGAVHRSRRLGALRPLFDTGAWTRCAGGLVGCGNVPGSFGTRSKETCHGTSPRICATSSGSPWATPS